MKTDPIARAYEGLSMPERVALAFHYEVQGEELEVLRLRDTIPCTPDGRPVEALAHGIERWTAITGYFGVNHWRLRALCNEAAFLSHAVLNPDLPNVPPSALFRFVEIASAFEAKLIALDRALETVCAEHGIDPADIRNANVTEAYRPRMTECAPDTEFEKSQLNALRGALVVQ